jgi:hypothetical protein
MSRSLVVFTVFALLALPASGVSTAAAERDQQEPFRPRAWFAERGGIEVQEPSLICLIVDLDTKDSVYIDTVPLWKVEPYDTIRGTFDEANPEPDVYEITFWAENDWPVVISYPPLADTFFYKTGIAEPPACGEFYLEVVSSNLLTSYARINFSIGYSTDVTVSIYDLTGKIITTLVSDARNKGSYSLRWDTSGMPSGVYFARLATPEFTFCRKILLLD